MQRADERDGGEPSDDPQSEKSAHTAVRAFRFAVSAWMVLVLGLGSVAVIHANSQDGVLVVDGSLRREYSAAIIVSAVLGLIGLYLALSVLDTDPRARLGRRGRKLAIAALVLTALPPVLAMVIIGGSGVNQ